MFDNFWSSLASGSSPSKEVVTFCSEQAAVEDNYGGEAGNGILVMRVDMGR